MISSTLQSAFLLFLVIDPFGDLPFVLAVTAEASAVSYRHIILREMVLAFLVLAVFAVAGQQILGYIQVQQASLSVAGGVILFLISLKMIFQSAVEIFDARYRQDPFLVPIAVPSLAGPSAITTVMILRTQPAGGLASLLLALLIVFAASCVIFLVGRRIAGFLGQRGVHAMEKFMGLLLNLISVNMVLQGVREFLS
ncbi:MAG TPA: MarC family protein [Gammaproteobacteria bacterium]|nr:MarC family protein [Gammaproteobacteria bacterium]